MIPGDLVRTSPWGRLYYRGDLRGHILLAEVLEASVSVLVVRASDVGDPKVELEWPDWRRSALYCTRRALERVSANLVLCPACLLLEQQLLAVGTPSAKHALDRLACYHEPAQLIGETT